MSQRSVFIAQWWLLWACVDDGFIHFSRVSSTQSERRFQYGDARCRNYSSFLDHLVAINTWIFTVKIWLRTHSISSLDQGVCYIRPSGNLNYVAKKYLLGDRAVDFRADKHLDLFTVVGRIYQNVREVA